MYIVFFFFFFFFFLGLHPWHLEVPRLRVETELQLLAYTTATAMPDPCRVCSLHHSLWQFCILYPLREARDQTCLLMDTSCIYYQWAINGNSLCCLFTVCWGVVYPFPFKFGHLIFPNWLVPFRSKTLCYSFKVSDKYGWLSVYKTVCSISRNRWFFFSHWILILTVEDISLRDIWYMSNSGAVGSSTQYFTLVLLNFNFNLVNVCLCSDGKKSNQAKLNLTYLRPNVYSIVNSVL